MRKVLAAIFAAILLPLAAYAQTAGPAVAPAGAAVDIAVDSAVAPAVAPAGTAVDPTGMAVEPTVAPTGASVDPAIDPVSMAVYPTDTLQDAASALDDAASVRPGTVSLQVSADAQPDPDALLVQDGLGGSPDPGTFQWNQLVAPGILAGSGLAIHFFAHETLDYEIRERVLAATAGITIPRIDDYVQYLPVTMHLSLGLMGAQCRLGFVDRLIESALAHAVCGVISWPSKQLFHTLRPNGANYHSFPSGHTDFVFTGAELMRMDYGWGWGLAGYGIATGVGFSRIYRNWHWLSDVLFGAGIGIFSAHAGGWLLEPVKDLLGIRTSGSRNLALVPAVDPWTGSATLSFALVF